MLLYVDIDWSHHAGCSNEQQLGGTVGVFGSSSSVLGDKRSQSLHRIWQGCLQCLWSQSSKT